MCVSLFHYCFKALHQSHVVTCNYTDSGYLAGREHGAQYHEYHQCSNDKKKHQTTGVKREEKRTEHRTLWDPGGEKRPLTHSEI